MIKNKLFYNSKIKNIKNNNSKKLHVQFENLFQEINNKFDHTENMFNLFNQNYNFSFKIKNLAQFKKFKKIALVGMGGSILGSMAIYNMFEKKIKKKFYFFDNLDENKIINFKKNQKLNKILFLIISKSGDTVETLTNVLSLGILKKNAKNIIIITEKKNNFLYSQAKKLNLCYFQHKNYIGGRYSVLSEVGIIPAYLMGIDIIKLRSNILKTFKDNKIQLKENSINLANLLRLRKTNNLIFLNYIPQLEQFLFWCQQLIAESLGKNLMGFLPVVSNVPRDHHSLLQLYLDGPKDKIFYIFSYEENLKEKIKVKTSSNSKNYLNNKSLSMIKNAQRKALIKSFIKNKVPYREFKISTICEKTLGELFSYFIFETIIIGRLSGLDPFDQPAVEQVKVFTQNYLS